LLKRLVIISTFEKQENLLLVFQIRIYIEVIEYFYFMEQIFIYLLLLCKFSVACPLADYSMIDEEGFPQNLYVRKPHVAPRLGESRKF
jgi:hypothetical protein